MERKLIAALGVLALSGLYGCGEKASKEDMIDAPVAPASMTQEQSSRARGLSEEQIARDKAGPGGVPGGAPAPTGDAANK